MFFAFSFISIYSLGSVDRADSMSPGKFKPKAEVREDKRWMSVRQLPTQFVRSLIHIRYLKLSFAMSHFSETRSPIRSLHEPAFGTGQTQSYRLPPMHVPEHQPIRNGGWRTQPGYDFVSFWFRHEAIADLRADVPRCPAFCFHIPKFH